MSASNENLSPAILKRIAKEIRELQTSPPEGIKVILNEENIADVQAYIQGPEGTPFESGAFRIKLVLSCDFPASPPKGYFITKIFHPNVSKNGEICVNTLKKDWNQESSSSSDPTSSNPTIQNILLIIKCLLINPNPESALNEEAGKLLLEDYTNYAEHAKMMTKIHAMSEKIAFGKEDLGGESTGGNGVNGSPKRKTVETKERVAKKRILKRL